MNLDQIETRMMHLARKVFYQFGKPGPDSEINNFLIFADFLKVKGIFKYLNIPIQYLNKKWKLEEYEIIPHKLDLDSATF